MNCLSSRWKRVKKSMFKWPAEVRQLKIGRISLNPSKVFLFTWRYSSHSYSSFFQLLWRGLHRHGKDGLSQALNWLFKGNEYITLWNWSLGSAHLLCLNFYSEGCQLDSPILTCKHAICVCMHIINYLIIANYHYIFLCFEFVLSVCTWPACYPDTKILMATYSIQCKVRSNITSCKYESVTPILILFYFILFVCVWKLNMHQPEIQY